MMDHNRVILLGKIVTDLKFTTIEGREDPVRVATVRLDVGHLHNGEYVPCFVSVTLWGQAAERAEKYLYKGRHVFIEGKLRSKYWEDENGDPRLSHIVVATKMRFVNAPFSPRLPKPK